MIPPFAITTETVYVRLPDGTYIRVELTHDGFNDTPVVACFHEEDNEVVAIDPDDYSYSCTPLADAPTRALEAWRLIDAMADLGNDHDKFELITRARKFLGREPA